MSLPHLVKRRVPARASSVPGMHASELSRHLLRAQEEERKRISRELHDGTGQGLMVLRLYLGMLASESRSPESEAKVQEALRLLDHTIEDLRRIIGRLSPRVLEEMGLLAALRKAVRDFSRSTGIKAHLELPEGLGESDHEIEVALYRSLQEALHNIAKHAQASNFVVRVQRGDDSVSLLVEDDGVGFSAKSPSSVHAFGLLGMKERAAALGGRMRVSSQKGSGTSIKITLPWRGGAERRAGSATEGRPGPAAFRDSDGATKPGAQALAGAR